MFETSRMGEIIDGRTLRFVRVVPHTPERVWRAITDERELTAWMRYPIQFEAREGGRAQFFGDGAERLDGKVFIFDPPRRLAFSFYGRRADQAELGEREWAVSWELEPERDGCRITFTHRRQPGAVLWGVGEGWHLFIDQLEAYLAGKLDQLPAFAGDEAEHPKGARQYRAHVTAEIRAYGEQMALRARESVDAGDTEAALARIDDLALAMRQLARIAVQSGVRPDYTLPDSTPTEL